MEHFIEEYGSLIFAIIGGLAVVGIFAALVFTEDGALRQLVLRYIQDIIG